MLISQVNPKSARRLVGCIMSVLLLCTIVACASWPSQQASRTYAKNETVILDDLQFKLNSAEFVSQFYNWVNQPSYPSATFLVVDISIINKRPESLPFHFRPVFSLVDNNDTKYDKSEQSTIMINMGRRGNSNPIEPINPNVEFKQEIVFDVPRQSYKLQVLVPYRAQISYGGYQKVSGRYFYYDLSSIK